MATWEDLDNESEFDEEEAEDEAKIAMALVVTIQNEDESSDVESCADSESETEVYSKLTRSKLVDSIKELLGLYENQYSELKKVKQRYIKLVKLRDSTKNELSEHDAALQEFITTGIDRTKVASMIYSINQNNKKGIGFTGGNSKPENQETKVMNNSKPNAQELQILKRSEPNK